MSTTDETECEPCKMFVGGLHADTDNESLKEYFQKWGEVTDSVVMRDGATRKSRGFGFVTFSDTSQALVCLKIATDGSPHVVDGKQVDLRKAVPKESDDGRPQTAMRPSAEKTKKVFLGGMSHDTTKEDVMEAFSEYNIISAQIMTEKYTEKPRGFGFAIFEDFESAEKVCTKKYFHIKDRDVEAKKALSQDVIGKPSGGGGGNRHDDKPSRNWGPRDGMEMYGRYPNPPPYPRGYGEYPPYMREYGYGMGAGGYPDRAAAAAAYASYGSGFGRYGPAQGYDMAAYASMYQQTGGMGSYNQSSSAYGPSRGYGGDKDRDRGGGRGGGAYHPYRR